MIIEKVPKSKIWEGGPRWLIATNTKCASMSLEATLEDVAVTILPRHDMDVSHFAEHRYMTRRNPLHRIVSMYWYFQRQPFWQDKTVNFVDCQSFNGFVDEFRKRRLASLGLPYYCTNAFNWTNTLCENEALVQPQRTYDIKDLDELITHLAITFGFSYRKMRNVNKSTAALKKQELVVSQDNTDWLENFLLEDNVRWNYAFSHPSLRTQ